MTEAAIAPAGGAASDLLNGNVGPAAPAAPVGPLSVEAALAAIEAQKNDKAWYARLTKGDPEVKAAALRERDALFKAAYPSPTAVSSQDDVSAQAVARNEAQWSIFFAGLRAQWSVTPEQEAEMRGGVIREEFRNWAIQQKDLMVKDKAFYRRLLDGDMAAKERWSRAVAMIGLRPVK